MAASKIIPKKSVVSKVPEPTALVLGEIAINYADKIIYGRHPSKSDTDPDAVVALGAPYIHSHDELYSLNKSKQLELTNAGEITITNGSIVTTITPTSTESRAISLPDKNGTLATTDDITSSVGDASSLVSPDASKTLTLADNGTLTYEHGEETDIFTFPANTGTLLLQGGDTFYGANPPQNPYQGLRWIDTDLGRSFDWIVDGNNIGAWFETGVGSDGRQVNLRVSDGYIQWQYAGDSAWVNLIAVSSLKGDAGTNGSSVELRVTAQHIQWRLVGASTWNDLVTIAQITGPPGSNATVTLASINSALGYTPDNPTASRTPSTHAHDDRYYTETEVDEKLATKQAAGSYAPATHIHHAADITEGTLDPARLPVFSATNQVVSSGALSVLTQSQEAEITTGTVVITSNGTRYIYKGSGSKTAEASYILLADITPEWDFIADKPGWLATFNPATATFSVSQITGLATVATTGSYTNLVDKPSIPAAQVSADWAATEGVAQILNKPALFSGSYNDLTNKPTISNAKARRSAWDAVNRYSYMGVADVGTAENDATWTITRISTSAAGSVTATSTATGMWTNRANLF